MAKYHRKHKAEQEAIQDGREKWIERWVKTSLPRAVAKACQEHGCCEWQECAMLMLDRLETAGLDVKRVEFSDGWGEPEDYPYYWAGNGEFTVSYMAKPKEVGTAFTERLYEVVGILKQEGVLLIDDAGTEGNYYTYIYVRAL